jgi:hypothetical protein
VEDLEKYRKLEKWHEIRKKMAFTNCHAVGHARLCNFSNTIKKRSKKI